MSNDEKMDAKDFSEMVFKTLSTVDPEALAEFERQRFRNLQWATIPWTDLTQAELSYDQYTTEEQVKLWYGRLSLKPPRFAWAPSPAAMFTAINMLRTVQMGTRNSFIEAIVPLDDPQSAARRTVLEAIIDRNVTTTMGGAVKNLLNWRDVGDLICLRDAIRELGHHHLHNMNAGPVPYGHTAPNVNESTIYPANHNECIGSLQHTTFCFAPYVHVCWFAKPPIETKIYDDGHLELLRWSDGYQIALPPVQNDDELEAAPAVPQLTDGATIHEPNQEGEPKP
jgi:hypothetical protein